MKTWFKKIKLLFAVFLIIPFTFFFVGCTTNGLSAYEIAVKNGFVGTEAEWLESLKGNNGEDGTNGKDAEDLDLFSLYETAKRNGEFSGDFMTFLSQFVTDSSIAKAVANQNLLSVFEVQSYTSQSAISPSKTGSGVLYSYTETGAYVITNAHVSNASSTSHYNFFTLSLYSQDDTKKQTATFVGSSKTYDLAVIYVSDNSFLKEVGAKAVTLSDDISVAGTGVISIGNTEGKGITVSKGIVSVESEEWPIELFSGEEVFSYRVMRHDAYISNGSSGGGLFDYSGNLIGITNGGVKDNPCINFAIPASTIKNVVQNIITNCDGSENVTIKKAKLGINCTVVDRVSSIKDGITIIEDTLQVTAIDSTCSVSRASTLSPENELSVNDIIYSIVIDGTEYKLDRYYILNELLLQVKQDDTVTFRFFKSGSSEITSLDITFIADDIISVV